MIGGGGLCPVSGNRAATGYSSGSSGSVLIVIEDCYSEGPPCPLV